MAGKILEDLREERFDEVAISAREYLRKTSAGVIKKNTKARDNVEIFLLKLLKCCTEILERSDHAEKVVSIVELAMEPLSRVRLSPGDIPQLAFEKVLIHLATRVFACERLATAIDVLECLYVRADKLARARQPPSGLPSLLEAIHKTAYTYASKLEKTLSRGTTTHTFYLSLFSLYVRFQVLVIDGWATAVKRMLSVATSVHQNHPELFHGLVVTTLDHLPPSPPDHKEEGSESHQDLPHQCDTYLQFLFHLANLSQLHKSTETYRLLQQKLVHALSLSGSDRQKKDRFGLQSSKNVWVCCLSVCSTVHQLKQTAGMTGVCCKAVSDTAEKLRNALPLAVWTHPSTSCLLEQLNEFRKFVDSADDVKACSSGDHLSFLYSAVEVFLTSSQLLEKCRQQAAENETRSKKLSMMLLKTLYACLDCHLALLKSGEGSIEVLRESSSVGNSLPTSDDIECMPILVQLGELLGNRSGVGFDPQEHQWLANLAYNFAVAYRQQNSMEEAAVVLQFCCQELLNWCSECSGDEEGECYLLCLEQAKFFKKFSVLCSCKRKCGGAQAVLEDVRSLLRSLPAPVLSASLCSSAVVHEWARANMVLRDVQQESLCHVLQDVSVGETLRWLWAELKEYQSLDSLPLQLMCLDAMLSLLKEDERENIFLANILVERARVQRGLPDQRCLSLKTCSDAISILDKLPQEKGSSFVKGKAFFWQAVVLHEQIVSRLEPLDGQDEVHCVAPLLTPNRLSLLLAEDAPRALELALKQWEGLKGAELEGEGQEFLDLLLQALALATLLHRTALSLQAVLLLLRHSPAQSPYTYWAIASLCLTIAQHRWEGTAPMLEACLSATSGPGHSEDQGEEHSAACVCARVALCAVMANTGQSERAAHLLLSVLNHKLLRTASSPSYRALAMAKLVCSLVLKQPKHAYNSSRSEFNPNEYLEYLLSGTDETATPAVCGGVAQNTPSPSQLEADAVHILTQLADRVIQDTNGKEEVTVPSLPSVTSKDIALVNPWSILQSLLFALHSRVGALVQQGRVDLARYYINHGLLTSSQYALRHWFCQFLLHLIYLKQLCGEFDDSQCHLNTVSQLLHLHSSEDSIPSVAEELQGSCDLNHLPDVSSTSLVAQYVHLYTQWCLNEGMLEKADKMIGQFESPGPMNAEETKVQSVWKDILNLLERGGGPCIGHARTSSVTQMTSTSFCPEVLSCSKAVTSGQKHRPLPSVSLCTTKELSRFLSLSRCDLHMALQAWDQLVVLAKAARQQNTTTPTPHVAAQLHFALGVGLYHQQQQSCRSTVVSTKKTPAAKSQRMKKKKKSGVGAGRAQASSSPSTPRAAQPHVAAFLGAHALCSTEMPAVLTREVCQWLSACVTDDTGRLPALFLAQSCGVSVYHRLVGKCHSSEDQNVSTGMLSALSAYLGLAPECPSKVRENRLSHQHSPLFGIPTWPALKEALSLLPKDLVICHVSTSPTNPDSLMLCRLHHSGPPVVSTVTNWSEMAADFDGVMAASLESMKLKQKVAWRNDRLRVNDELKSLLCRLENTCLGPAKSLLIGLPSQLTAASWSSGDMKHLAEETGLPAHFVVSLLQCSDVFQEGDLEKLSSQLQGGCVQERVMGSPLQSAMGDSDLTTETERCPVVLITDRLTHYLPWESLSCLHNHSVTRMPSLLFAANHFNKHQDLRPVPTDRSFCILNPQGNLSRTEQTFAPWLKKHRWKGLTGKPPSKEQLVSAVTENDLFVYIGHGGGQEYISSHERSKLSCRAVMVLMGCKTAKLMHCGQLDGGGIALDYLLAGCPALVGNLWDVTDKDIDRYTKALLDSVTDPSKSDWTLQDHVALTRVACDLRYLTGSAPIVYGLPVLFSSK